MITLKFIHASWCGPCKAMEPTIKKFVDDHSDKFKLEDILLDDDGNITAKYNVRSVPLTVVCDENDNVLMRLNGLHTMEQLESVLEHV